MLFNILRISVSNTRKTFLTLNPRSRKPKKLHEGIKGGGGGGGRGSIGPLPSTLAFYTILSPFDLIFGTYDELSLYFQLIETMWCLIAFHGNHNHINDVTNGRHL